jgi:hypothetical protein
VDGRGSATRQFQSFARALLPWSLFAATKPAVGPRHYPWVLACIISPQAAPRFGRSTRATGSFALVVTSELATSPQDKWQVDPDQGRGMLGNLGSHMDSNRSRVPDCRNVGGSPDRSANHLLRLRSQGKTPGGRKRDVMSSSRDGSTDRWTSAITSSMTVSVEPFRGRRVSGPGRIRTRPRGCSQVS